MASQSTRTRKPPSTPGDELGGVAEELGQLAYRWLAAYRQAWEDRDADAAAELFSSDAIYAWGPFEELRGRDAIRERWAQATADQRDIRFRWEVLGVIGPRAVARWWCDFGAHNSDRRVVLDGIFLIELDIGGLCTSFREWWAARESDGYQSADRGRVVTTDDVR